MQNPVEDPLAAINTPPVERPIVASYIVTFLKSEMLHVYRQLRALRHWQPVVFCQKREMESAFPFEDVHVVPKPATHQLRRWWQKTVMKAPITIYRSEARRLREEITKVGARLLHVYFGHIGVHLLPLLEILQIPVVVSFHGADAQVNFDQPKHLAALQRVFALARLIFVRSESLADRLVAAGCPVAKIRLQRTGIPLEQLVFRQRTAPADGAWRCVQASRLIAKKGLTTTVRAFAEFSKVYPRARLTFAGDGPLRDTAWRLAIELKVEDRVNFTGFLSQSELRALYDQTHFFLHPSELGPDGDQEGVPNAVLEAMALGVPPLATTHGGIPEAVKHGVSGLLVPERDHEALAREWIALAGDPERYAALSRGAFERVSKAFSLRATAAVLEGYYHEAVR
jgi:colanic acid/amylovoran biosynthesis glycosyltransferase